MMGTLSEWNYDRDPISPLYFEEALAGLKVRWPSPALAGLSCSSLIFSDPFPPSRAFLDLL